MIKNLNYRYHPGWVALHNSAGSAGSNHSCAPAERESRELLSAEKGFLKGLQCPTSQGTAAGKPLARNGFANHSVLQNTLKRNEHLHNSTLQKNLSATLGTLATEFSQALVGSSREPRCWAALTAAATKSLETSLRSTCRHGDARTVRCATARLQNQSLHGSTIKKSKQLVIWLIDEIWWDGNL